MNAATFAAAGPKVSAMISSVSALVPRSMPLLTKMRSGSLVVSSRVRRSFRSVRVCLYNASKYA